MFGLGRPYGCLRLVSRAVLKSEACLFLGVAVLGSCFSCILLGQLTTTSDVSPLLG